MPKAQQVEFLLAGVRNTNGVELAAGLLYSYAAGTTTPKALYSAADKSGSHTQPVSLDGNGRLQAWGDGAYKFVIKTAAGVTVYTFDNVLYGYDDGELKWGGTSAGTGNAQTVSISSVTALASGMRIAFIAGNSNSGAVTLNVSGLGAVAVNKIDGVTALATGDIVAGDIVDVVYNSGGGGAWRLMSTKRNRLDTYIGTSGGSANAQTGSLTPAPSALAAGLEVCMKAGFTNTTTTPTLNINGLGAATIIKADGTALRAGYITANNFYHLTYNGTNWILNDPTPKYETWSPVPVASTGALGSITSDGQYVVRPDGSISFDIQITATLSGGPSAFIGFDLPIPATTQKGAVCGRATYAAGQWGLFGYFNSTSQIYVGQNADIATTFPNGVIVINVSGTYRG